MIILDRALAARAGAGDPIRVGLVGAGALGRGLIRQLVRATPGIELAAVSNRTPARAEAALAAAGVADPARVDSVGALERAMRSGTPALTDDPTLLCQTPGIDAVIEATGEVEFGARVALAAIENGKHVFINAELDGTIGPILNIRAEAAGAIVSALDGDQPGTQMNLYRFAAGMGFEPLVCGNIKGLEDHYRTPATQRGFAEQWGLSPSKATSFADGSKISFEQTVVANATGMAVARRGMNGHAHTGHVDEMTSRYDVDDLRRRGGIVDYVIGPKPGPGVFVFAAHPDPGQHRYLEFWKLGTGPLYAFYAPYHLAHMEAPSSVARAVLFGDPVTTALAPSVEVVAVAKRPLQAGETLDEIGGYMAYGQCENAGTARSEGLLPLGLAEGCQLVRDVARDQVLAFDDVEVPQGRTVDGLWREQLERFGVGAPA